METQILNYRIILEPEIDSRTKKKIYVAFCPALGVSDWGKTVEQAIAHIQEGIVCHLESLRKHHKEIPVTDSEEFMIANAKIIWDKSAKFSFT